MDNEDPQELRQALQRSPQEGKPQQATADVKAAIVAAFDEVGGAD